MGWPDLSTHLMPISIPWLLELSVASYPSLTLLPQGMTLGVRKSQLMLKGIWKSVPVTNCVDRLNFWPRIFEGLRNRPSWYPNVKQVAESEDARVVREFSQLLDACEDYMKMSDLQSQDKSSVPTISERFMGVKAAVVTDNSSLKSFVGKHGFSVLRTNQLISSGSSDAEPSVDHVASELLKLLGFEDGKTLEKSQFDLVFLHVGAAEKLKGEDTEYVNALVGELMHLAEPGSEISSRLHMSLVLSYGAVSEDDDSILSVSVTNPNHNSDFSSLFPRQSYIVKGSNLRENVRQHSPMLLAQWQSGVTRKDMVETFSFQDFKEHGGNLTIPADRFLHEVAFKLWKAPKYGA